LLLFKTVIAGDSWGLIAVPVIEQLGDLLRWAQSGFGTRHVISEQWWFKWWFKPYGSNVWFSKPRIASD
jgi:hypothetical protein